MPNLATVFKDEISRLARKELRGENQALKKASVQYRSDIAALKRRVQALEQLVKRLAKGSSRKSAAPDADLQDKPVRFSAKGLATQRRRLGLSAADAALLMGVSAQSVYKWEDGKTRPRASQMPAIVALRGLGKTEAAARLESLR
ncbi:MAG: helix-turn-helix transcriptional regulator [Polaromonas sp.]|nr:helix-turn-helix transcriptional regulator [Polaromonas sp.]